MAFGRDAQAQAGSTHWFCELGPVSFHGSPGCTSPQGQHPDGKADTQRQLAHCMVGKQTGQLAKNMQMESRQNSSNGEWGERQRENQIILTWAISPKSAKWRQI